MKKVTIIGLLLMVLCHACKKSDPPLYNTSDNIYFDFTPTVDDDKVDSVIYSFADSPGKEQDTILIPVRVSGSREKKDRKFTVSIVDSSTTAISSLHYKPLEKEYIIPADSGEFLLPIILLSTDSALKTKSVTISLALQASSDFGISFKEIRTGFIRFSNRLERPVWWDVWVGELGVYSRVKHELFIRAAGTNTLSSDPSNYMETPKTLYYIRRFKSFLQDPFKWVTDYPDAGYVITLDADGFYYFYSSGNPEVRYKLEKNDSDGKYYFRDEDGNRII
jgi:hypothetical protein